MLPPNYRVIVATDAGQRFAGHSRRWWSPHDTDAEGRGGRAPGLGGWIALGMKHIFERLDHLGFLLALLLVGGTWRRVLWMVTSFTLAHSLTLGATALGW